MWKAVQYLPDLLPEISDMTREFYGDSAISNLEFLKWQYQTNPAGPAMIKLARNIETELLAGQYVVIPMRFKVYGETIKAVLSLNTLTRPIYSGQGIFTELAKTIYQECSEQGIDFCYGFPNPNSYPGFTKKLEFTDIGSVPLLLRPLNTKALLKRKFSSLIVSLALPLHLFYKVKNLSYDQYEVYSLTALDLTEINTFWAKVQDKYPIIGVRDADYINWRYFEIPYRDYQIYGIRHRSSTELLGYIVGRCTEVATISTGMIVDFLVEPNQPVVGSYLVNRLLRFFENNNIDLAGSLMMPHTEESQILKANGFFTCPKSLEPQPFPIIFRRLSPVKTRKFRRESPDSFLRFNQWFLTMGDYDVI